MLFIVLQIASTLFMVGLIWFVQIVHYPLFLRTGETEFKEYEYHHTRLTSRVVAPVMLTELASTIFLVLQPVDGLSAYACWMGFLLLASIWGMTFLIQVPQHQKLQQGFDRELIEKLVFYNWFRTAAWTARGVVMLWMVAELLRD